MWSYPLYFFALLFLLDLRDFYIMKSFQAVLAIGSLCINFRRKQLKKEANVKVLFLSVLPGPVWSSFLFDNEGFIF